MVISRSMKHGVDGDNECCAAVRGAKCSSSKRSKWYRSLSSKTIPDIQSDDSLADGNSISSETRSNRTSTWVDCYTLPGSEPRHQTPGACTTTTAGGRHHHHHTVVDAADVYGEEMQEASSCTDSVTTIYTRLPPTSSARQRAINCCALATESCDENCFTTKYCKDSERRPDGRRSRRSSPEAMMSSCGRRCSSRSKDDGIASSTVVADLKHRQSSDWNGGGSRTREQSFERKYKALKRYCIDTLGCIPPPPTPLCFE